VTTRLHLLIKLDSNVRLPCRYEVRFTEGLECGGAYLKMLEATPGFNPKKLDSDTPYVIMFGPDRCGGTNKIHFILRHQNPVSKEWEEKHMANAPPIQNGAWCSVLSTPRLPCEACAPLQTS
jgi:calnexin